jgi:hypothetical protein
VLEERCFQLLLDVKDYAADDLIFKLLYRYTLKAALPLFLLYNKVTDDKILINGHGFFKHKFLQPVKIDLMNYPISRLY